MESLDFKVVFSYIKSLGSRRWSLNSNIVLVTHSPPLSLSLSLSLLLGFGFSCDKTTVLSVNFKHVGPASI